MSEAPEVIYLQWTGSEYDEDNTWCSDEINDDDIEYIKKALAAEMRGELDKLTQELYDSKYIAASRKELLRRAAEFLEINNPVLKEIKKELGDD